MDEGTTAAPVPWASAPQSREELLPEHILRLRPDFVLSLRERLELIAVQVDALRVGADQSPGGLRTILREAHRISGTAASFGGHRVGAAARDVDHQLRGVLEGGEAAPSPELLARLLPLFEELIAAGGEFVARTETGVPPQLQTDVAGPPAEDPPSGGSDRASPP